jgi:hypothetical protein
MDTLLATLGPIDVQSAVPEIDLRPAELTEFLSAQPMPIR